MNDPLPLQRSSTFLGDWASAWNRFWFTPTAPHTLAVIRIATGLIAFYTCAVWTFEFQGFLGGELIPEGYRQLMFYTAAESASCWSHLDWLPAVLRLPAHFVSLAILLLFTIGWQTRTTAVLSALLVISYCNRAMGALFGLDQMLAMLTLSLAVSNCGDVFSVDAWLKRRTNESQLALARRTANNCIATRLIQVHLCIVYFFAGLGKCQGDKWWDGEAVWGALASREYQTLDVLWISDHMWLVALLTLATLFWEIGYAALIWPRLTRPFVLAMAVPMHLGIGFCLGMMEFGLIMLVANLAFVVPAVFARFQKS